jgi:hypothetical protein
VGLLASAGAYYYLKDDCGAHSRAEEIERSRKPQINQRAQIVENSLRMA